MIRALLYLALLVLAFLTLIPFSYLVITSFKDNAGNAAGLYLPYENTRTIEFGAGQVDVEKNTIKPVLKSSGPIRTGEQLTYKMAAGGGIGGLKDGQSYYAVALPGAVVKLTNSPAEAETAAKAFAAAQAEKLPTEQAVARVQGIDLTSAGAEKGESFVSPFHVLWDTFTTGNYVELFRDNKNIPSQIANSFFFSAVTALLATLFCAMGGYALAMFHFKGRKVLTAIVLAALIIPATMLIAPNYQLVFRMGLLDTLRGLILPAVGPAFLVFLFRQAMISGLPSELLEAGRIDGCGEIRMFFQIALPLVRPMVSASLLITFIACWNNFVNPQVILQSPENFTLSVAVAQLQDVYSVKYGTLMAGTVISVLPVMILFLLLQKEFIAGLTAGAVKG